MQYRSIHPQYNKSILLDTSKRSIKSGKQVKFPEFIQKIVVSDRPDYGNLYISNLQAAENKQLLRNQKINGILSVAKDYAVKHPKQVVRYSKYVPLQDQKNAQIYQHLQECVDFISNTLLLTNVLVHCVSGENRSVSAIIAYLIHSKKMSFQQAFDMVKNNKKLISLDDNIREQLKKYQLDLKNSGLRKSKYNPSVRVNTQIQNSSINPNQSYFKINTLGPNQSFVYNKNAPNPEIETHMSKSRQTYRSKTCQDSKTPNINVYSPKLHTKQQRLDNSLSISNKEHKSMNLQVRSSSLGKTKADKPISKVSSIRYQSQYQIASNTQKDKLQNQFLDNKNGKAQHVEFIKKLSLLVSRNQEINIKYRQVESNFDRIKDQNKMILQSELNEIYNLRETMKKQYNQRKIKISAQAKNNLSKIAQEMNNSSVHQSRISSSKREYSGLE